MPNRYKPKKNSKKVNRKSKHIALQAILFVVTLLFILLVLLTVELKPVKSVSSWGGPEESFAMATATGKILTLGKQTGSEYCSIEFSPGEINALFAMVLRMYANEKKPSDPALYGVWNNGNLNIDCSIKFIGIYFNFYLTIKPAINNGNLYLQVNSCKLGKMPLPAAAVEKALSRELNKQFQKDQRLQKSLSCISRMQAEKSGAVSIEFHRKKSVKLIRSLL